MNPTEVRVDLVRNDGVVPDPLRPGSGGSLLPPAPPLLSLPWTEAHQETLPGSFVPENLPSLEF